MLGQRVGREQAVIIYLFLKNLAEKLSRKDGEPYAIVITWLRARLSFEILRIPFLYANDFLEVFRLHVNAAEVFLTSYFRISLLMYFYHLC